MIVAGFGFTTSADQRSLVQVFEAAAGDGPIDALATPADKAAAQAFRDFAHRVQKPVHAISPALLSTQTTQTHSAVSRQNRDTGSVAEAAALAAAGPGAILIRSRVISADGRATCAVAKGEDR